MNGYSFNGSPSLSCSSHKSIVSDKYFNKKNNFDDSTNSPSNIITRSRSTENVPKVFTSTGRKSAGDSTDDASLTLGRTKHVTESAHDLSVRSVEDADVVLNKDSKECVNKRLGTVDGIPSVICIDKDISIVHNVGKMDN